MTIAAELPAELAGDVFELLGFADRIRATHVCKHWRSVSLAHGGLWSHIRCSGATSLDARLERTRRVAVDLQVTDVTRENFEHVLETVSRHLYHIRLLRLYADPSSPLDLHLFSTVYSALGHPAPCLEALDIQLFHDPIFPPEPLHFFDAAEGSDANPTGRVVPATLFLGQAPLLRKFTFAGMRLPADGLGAVSAMQNISRLHFNTRRLSAVQLSAIVSLPRLRALYLEVYHCDVPHVPAPESFRLDELWLFGPYETAYFNRFCPGPLLSYLGCRHIRHFIASQNLDGLGILSFEPRCRPHTLLVEEWSVARVDERWNIPLQAWRIIDESGFVSDLLDIHTGDYFIFSGGRRMLSQLRELVVPYSRLRLASDDLSFDHMTRLCLRVNHCEFNNPEWAISRIPCPELRILELWGGEGVADVLVAEVFDYVRNYLVLNEARPPELIVDAAPHWMQFHDLFSGIRREGPAPEPFVTELRSKWHVAISDK